MECCDRTDDGYLSDANEVDVIGFGGQMEIASDEDCDSLSSSPEHDVQLLASSYDSISPTATSALGQDSSRHSSRLLLPTLTVGTIVNKFAQSISNSSRPGVTASTSLRYASAEARGGSPPPRLHGRGHNARTRSFSVPDSSSPLRSPQYTVGHLHRPPSSESDRSAHNVNHHRP